MLIPTWKDQVKAATAHAAKKQTPMVFVDGPKVDVMDNRENMLTGLLTA